MAPDNHAILAPGLPPLTYRALWTWVNDAAHRLRSLGVSPSDRVAVLLPNGPDAALAMIAIATCAVCVPLNPGFTADELRRYFGELRVSALLTCTDLDTSRRGVAHSLDVAVIEQSPWCSAGPGAFNFVITPTERNIPDELVPSVGDAFLLLTSGTSSRPKTVPLTHAAVCLSAYNVGATLALEAKDRLLNVLPLFHVHGLVSGLVAALAAGSSVVCTSGFDPGSFFGWLKEFRPTWYTAVPTIHQAVLSAAQSAQPMEEQFSLRVIRSASSSLPPSVTHGLETLFGVPVIDTYGMTEAASQIAANSLGQRKPGSVGQAVGAEIAIIDEDGRPLETGRRGEIALRGPAITRGYDNDAAATEHAFRGGWFLTGDVGYLDRDGYLFIVGRIKEIINRGGQKVAPAEVEQALLSHPDVVEAAVCSILHARLGEDVAAAVVLRQDAKATARTLREFAGQRLASFKVPGLIRIVPAIPKGPAGKVKRSELGAALSMTSPTLPAEGRSKIAAPRSNLEQQLANMWQELLENDHIGIEDDVFALGADSIIVTRMLARLRSRYDSELSLKDLFDAPTVTALAARLETSQRLSDAASSSFCDPPVDTPRVEGNGPRPVSILQEHALRIAVEFAGLPQFNAPFAYRLEGPLNVAALERSLEEVVRRHDSLRTRFAWVGEVPVGFIAPANEMNFSFLVENLAAGTPIGNHQTKSLLLKKARLKAEQESLMAFDIERAPLFRARLFRFSAEDHVLLLILHDIIVDGWSTGIFMEEVSQLYAAFAADRPAQLPEPGLQFSDFARWQRQWCTTGSATRQFAYWKERLREAPPVFSLNTGFEGAVLAATSARTPVYISNELVARLRALGDSQAATLFMTLLAGFKALLLARSGRNDICVAIPMANRSQLSTERVIGPVANTAVIRTRMDADLPFQEALSRVRDSVLEACDRQDLPFDVLARRLAEEDGVNPASLIQVFFVLQNAFRQHLKLADVAVQPFADLEGQPISLFDRTWLKLTLKETPSGLTGICTYKDQLFEPITLQQWMADYKTILSKAASNPETSLGRLAFKQ
jgi:acyl-CoA synthetase (AMP-forming)/AMP-acid ligase II/acyl carrier protein